jgi:hypothetical protein
MTSKPQTSFAAKVRSLRLTNRQFARMLNVHEVTVSRWMSGKATAPALVHLMVDMLVSNPQVVEAYLPHWLDLDPAKKRPAPKTHDKSGVNPWEKIDSWRDLKARLRTLADHEERAEAEMENWLNS